VRISPAHNPRYITRWLIRSSFDQRLLAMRNGRWLRLWRPVIALAIAVLASLLPLAAQAQFFGNWDDRSRRQGSGGFFPFFDHPYNQPQPYNSPGYGTAPPPPVESFRAPPPRKVDTVPTTTIVVIGDSLADWLAYGLEDIYADQPQIGIERKIRATSGLIHYDPRNDTLEWSQAVKDILATEKPAAIVVMLGLNDRVPLKLQAREAKPEAKPEGKQPPGASTAAQGKPEGKQAPAGTNAAIPPGQAAQPQQGQDTKTAAQPPPAASAQPSEEQSDSAVAEPPRPVAGGTYEFHTDEWAQLYTKRVDDMMAALKSKGVPVLWVGLPAIRGPRATSEMSYLDDLYEARADKAGIVYVDIWDGFVDENGRYTVQGPDFEGQIRRLRAGDGVHFSKVGAEKLAHYVEHELTRVMANPVVPVALPGPEALAPAAAAPGAPRPAVGPVLPLAATRGGEGGDLLGAGSRPSPPSAADPTAAAVLVRGEALAAPGGRADNFAWPRPTFGTTVKPAQASPAPTSASITPAPGASTQTTPPSAPAGAVNTAVPTPSTNTAAPAAATGTPAQIAPSPLAGAPPAQ
jgi:uncharacterized protein